MNTESISTTTEVWVAFHDYGSEGKSEPLAVFASERLALIFQEGARAVHSSINMVKLPLIKEINTDTAREIPST